MIIIMKPGTPKDEITSLSEKLQDKHIQVHISHGAECTLLGLVGDTTQIDRGKIEINPYVDRIMRVSEPYKKSNRKFHPEDTIVKVENSKIGGGDIAVIAGPCSVESENQIIEVAKAVKKSGAAFLRGGAFKPRTSPYSFQGLADEGLRLLSIAKKETGLPIVTEIMSPKWVEWFEEMVDVIQIGARNMQNFDLLKEVGKTSKAILLKRGPSSTIEEWLMAAEYIMAEGNEQVILCERGIRTFETYTRNSLDMTSIPAIKKLSHLPIIVDPSHATGMAWMVEPMALAAVAAGADGIMVEVHNDPKSALCDGEQSLTPSAFDELMKKIKIVNKVRSEVL